MEKESWKQVSQLTYMQAVSEHQALYNLYNFSENIKGFGLENIF